MTADMDAFRREIDACDREIVHALGRRASAAMAIGRIKRQKGTAVFAPERERQVYDKIATLNEGPLPPRAMQAIYREIMSGCIALEQATRISYLGPPGTFTHQASREKFGASQEYLPAAEIRDVFLAVSRGHADYGVVPVENSTEGSVTETFDMLLETGLSICSEIFLEIHQNLLATCALSEIREVWSHPNALAQCRQWLAANLHGVPIREVASTAIAAEKATRESGIAAIASEAAAAIHGLEILVRSVEDRPENTTRFVVLAHAFPERPSGDDRTSILFAIRHEAGSLFEALLPFKDHGINLTRIESRPSKKVNWEYAFFVDFEGHIADPGVSETLDEVRRRTDDYRLLGSYPRAAHQVRVPPPPEKTEP